jgi:hypothetical protein
MVSKPKLEAKILYRTGNFHGERIEPINVKCPHQVIPCLQKIAKATPGRAILDIPHYIRLRASLPYLFLLKRPLQMLFNLWPCKEKSEPGFKGLPSV